LCDPSEFGGFVSNDLLLRLSADQSIDSSDASRLLAAIVEFSDDAIVSKNLDGIITSWNGGAEKMFGYTPSEAIGKHITLIVPLDRRDEETAILNRLRRGDRVDHFETVRMRKDGTTLDVALTISPVRDAAGHVVGASKIARDITERKRAQRAQSEQARLLDLSSDAILVRDSRDRVTYWSKGACDLYGYSSEEALGRVTHELLKTEFPASLESIVERLHREGRWRGELTHMRKDGTRIVVSSRWVLDQANERSSSILETNTDIRQHKQLEGMIKESEISTRLLRAQDEERRRIARELHDGVGQLVALLAINSAAVEREKAKLSPEVAQHVTDISELVKQISADIRTTSYLLHPPLLDDLGLQAGLSWLVEGFAQRSKIATKLEVPTDLERMPQDYELCLFRIAQECLTNIHRHSGSSTALVRVWRAPGEVNMEVSDEGRGLSLGAQAKIASGESSGVGLRGIRERVQRLGGSLKIDAQTKGMTVLVTLPLIQEVLSR
jgi:PAS domain S-box-containing protein